MSKFQGKIIWLFKTRPDLLFAGGMKCAGEEQIDWTKQMLRYLAGSPDRGIILDPGDRPFLHGGSDADWGGDVLSEKSTGGGYLMLGKQALTCFEIQQAS